MTERKIITTIAARLKKLRSAKGASLADVAAGTALTKPHVWEMERGGVRASNPTIKTLRALASYYGVTVSHLIGEQEYVAKRPTELPTVDALMRMTAGRAASKFFPPVAVQVCGTCTGRNQTHEWRATPEQIRLAELLHRLSKSRSKTGAQP